MEPVQPEQLSVEPLPAAAAMAPDQPSRMRRVFIGPNGIRAGWRILIFIVVFAALMFGLRQIRRAIWGIPAKSPAMTTLGPQQAIRLEFRIALLVLLATFVMSRIEKRPMRWYGLGVRQAFGTHFWEGCVWGFAALSLLLAALRLTGAYYFGDVATRGPELLKFGLLWAVAFILVGFSEEYLFRGYMQYTLTTGIGFWGAALLLSGLFALGHAWNPGETSVGVMDVFLGGMVLALMLQRTGNLWFPIGFHAAWDWAQSFLYGVADSGMKSAGTWLAPHIPQNKPWWLTGGTVGPEGSVFSCIIELLLLALVAWRFPRQRYPEGINVVTTTPEPSSPVAAL